MKLSEVCEFIVDCPHSTAVDEGIGYPLIRTPNVGKGRLILDSVHRVSEETYQKRNARAVPKAGDLIFAREAPAGNVALIQDGQKVCLGQRTVLIRPDTNKVDAGFLTYYILAPEQQYRLLGSANGATVAHVNLPVIRNLEISLPDILVQKVISKNLIAYDDLIENNQKQIKLLEECAKRLYKEWFVDLRFPGHEQTKIVDGVPEGWRFKNIDSVFVIQYGKNLPTNQIQADGKYPVYGANGVIGYYNYKNCDDYNVLITSRGNGSGEVLRTHDRETFVTNNSFVVTPKNPEYGILFIYELLKMIDFKRICTGSAQPQLTNTAISTLNILTPLDKTITQFSKLVEPFHIKIENLIKQNRLLEEARDRLLPKLMNGEIEL